MAVTPHRLRTPVQVTEENGQNSREPDEGFFATSDISDGELRLRFETQDWDVLTEKASTTETVSLSWCELRELPPQVPSLTQLTRLYLTYNNLTDLPQEFQQLEHLQILNLGFNLFPKIPPAIFTLTNLQVLFLKNNQLTSDGIGGDIRFLSKLEELYLESNQIKVFPRPLCEMSTLLLLTLSSNAIPEIPDDIQGMTKLKVLKMRSNRLKEIPQAFCKLKCLELACFAQNMIATFPFDQVEKLSKLRDLCLYANRLRDKNKLERSIQKFAERGGIFRAEENRVSIPRTGGVCDSPFKSWTIDILLLHDGTTEVKTWVDQMSTRLKDYNFTPQDHGPNDKNVRQYLKRSQIVAVVCSPRMCDLLWEKGEDGANLRATLAILFPDTQASSESACVVWLLIYQGSISTFFLPHCQRMLVRSPDDHQDDRFFSQLVNVIKYGSQEDVNSLLSPRI